MTEGNEDETEIVDTTDGCRQGDQGHSPDYPQAVLSRRKILILLENYFFPADPEAQIEAFVDHYNHQRYHESINNLTPADVYFGRGQEILKQRERRKLKIKEICRLQYRKHAA